MGLFVRYFSCAVVAVLFSGTAFAQVANPTAGQVQETLKKAPALRTPDEPAVEKPRQSRSSAPSEGKKITVNTFTFVGNSVYSAEVLADLVKSYLNHPISLAEIYEAADAVTDYYVKNGYGLASVTVPAQKVDAGTVKLEVIEGRLSRVSVEGNVRHRSSFILGALGDVKPGELYRGGDLESGIRKINELPGLKAKAVVTAGDQYGTSDIVIKTSEQLVNGSISLDNYGREQIDEYRLTGQVQINNPFTIEDQLQLLALHSDASHLRYYYGAYSVPLNYYGTRLGVSYGRTDFIVKNTPVLGYNNNSKVTLFQPLLRSLRDSADFSASVIRNNSNTTFSGTQIAVNNITLYEFSGSYNHIYESQAVTQVSATVGTTFQRRNTPPGAVAAQEDQALRLELDALHLQPLFERFSLLTHINGVYSPDALADSQKYNLGGPQNVRGYPASELRGDSGYFGSLSVTRPFFAGPVVFSPRVFVDSGRVFNTGAADPYDSLSSVGIGTDVSFGGGNFKIDWSRPLTNHKASDDHDTGRLFGSLSYSF